MAALTLIASIVFMAALAISVYSVIETLSDASDNFAAIEHNLQKITHQHRTIRLGEPHYQGARPAADIHQLPLRLEMPRRAPENERDKIAA